MRQCCRFFLSAFALLSFAAAQFETRTTAPTIQGPESIAVGDFNHDGRLDIAVAAYRQSTQIMVFLGNGDGTFQSPVYYPAGASPYSVVAADLTGDGNLDLAVADFSVSGTVNVLLGNGDGTFQSAKSYPIPPTPNFVSVGDFNDDHRLDLVTVNSPSVSILLGNGDGTFQSPVSFNPTHDPSALGIGDFNRDGKLDLAIGEQFAGISQVQIYFGNGDGTFRQGASYPVGTQPQSIAVSDFRRDGKLDLAVGCSLSSGVSVLVGNGDGTFQPSVTYPAPEAYWVAAADLNGDGRPDLAAASFSLATSPPTTEVSVLLGNGDGTFQPATTYPSGGENTYIAVGDFNNDKKLDLIVADPLNNDVLVLLNTGVISLSPTTPLVFAPQLLGTESSAQTLSLTNTGVDVITISSVSVQGQYKLSDSCGKSLAGGAKCAITVRSAPTTEGTLTGTVTIRDSASSKPQAVELSGAGTVVKMEPSSLEFSAQTVHTKSQPKQVQLTNTGSTSLSISNVYLEGANWTSFSQTNTCGSALQPGAKCLFTVTFEPVKTGSLTASLNVYDSGGGTFQSVALSGTGD